LNPDNDISRLGRRLLEILGYRGGIPALAALVLCSIAACLGSGGKLAPSHGDVPSYLTAAYHLRYQHFYTVQRGAGPVAPGIGREPAYPLFLAGLMAVDPALAKFTPDCLRADDACPQRTYRAASLANLALIELAGITLFFLARLICGTPIGGLIASAYLLLNLHLNKGWADPMSDRLAVFLLALALLATAHAGRSGKFIQYALAAAAFAALTLTKTIFLPFCLAAWIAALLTTLYRTHDKHHALLALCLAACVYALPTGGWAWRNYAVSGQFRLTDVRSGVALSTREVFDHMSLEQNAAALVYWTRGIGPRLAQYLFGTDAIAPFDLNQPGGFYDVGQHAYQHQVATLRRTDHLEYWQATTQVDASISAAIRHDWAGYATSMLPLIYRGIWIDEFALLGVPCLIFACWRAARRRDRLLLLLLSSGLFNLVAYAAVSLNVPRYQMTAMPAVALAVAVIAVKRKWPGALLLDQAGDNSPGPVPDEDGFATV
jgi:hypothetical protein